MSSTFYTRQSLHRHYPTRKKLRKFKKRWMAQKGHRFCLFIVQFKHGLSPLYTGNELLFFKLQPDH